MVIGRTQIIPSDRRDYAIGLVDFADSFASKTMSLDVSFLDYAAAHQVEYWLGYMTSAAENNRPVLVAEFARLVTDRIDDAARNLRLSMICQSRDGWHAHSRRIRRLSSTLANHRRQRAGGGTIAW